MKLSRGEKIYVALLHVIMILAGLICLAADAPETSPEASPHASAYGCPP